MAVGGYKGPVAHEITFDAQREPMFEDEHGNGWVPLARFQEFEDEVEAVAQERRRLTRRMLQALDAYWLGYEGLPSGRNPRGRYDSEDWWHRFEKYRKQLEEAIA